MRTTTMTNEEKAREYLLKEHISPLNNILHQCDLKTEFQYHKDIENAFIKGAEWKDEQHAKEKQQWIDKAVEWLESVNLDYYQIREGVLGEQNPAWSEDDDKMIDDLTQTISQYAIFAHREPKEIIQWLKSLKPQSQQKQEWSEEDEDAIGIAVKALEDMCDVDDPTASFVGHHLSFDEAVKRLKVLKPQPHWKPTEEQINALLDCVNLSTKENFFKLNSLYEQLIKL